MSNARKVVVIGGTGLIGSKVVTILESRGCDVVSASSRNGINAYTGEGLDDALAGASAVIDVSNMMSFDEPVIRDFFATTSRNLTEREIALGVDHHVVLSIVGADDLAANPYMSGKLAQEDTVKASGQPYTIVRATQFYEFIETLVGAYAVDGEVKVPDIDFQPIAADDVAEALVDVALAAPRNGSVDLCGPTCESFEAVVRAYAAARKDGRQVSADSSLGYFGASVSKSSLVPTGDAIKGSTSLGQWLHDH